MEKLDWDGVVVTFKDVPTLISWEATQDDDLIQKVDYYCYKCFYPLSLGGSKTRATQVAYDHVTWGNGGHKEPMYTTFCTGCRNYLDIPTDYCCIDHQTKIAPTFGVGILKIMVDHISRYKSLCPFIVLQAVLYHDLTRSDVTELMEHGKEHIPLFVSTPAGMLLHALLMGSGH